MADVALMKWIATRYPDIEVEMKKDVEFRVSLTERRQDLRQTLLKLVDHASTEGHSIFELHTLEKDAIAALDDIEITEMDRDLRLERTKANIDELLDKVVHAIRGLPQTTPIEMQSQIQRPLDIAISMANPTLPTGAADTTQRVFTRPSRVF